MSFKTNRGGSWNDYGRLARSAYRYRNSSDDRYDYIGFRLIVRTKLQSNPWRGGSLISYPSHVRSSVRNWCSALDRDHKIGFRLTKRSSR